LLQHLATQPKPKGKGKGRKPVHLCSLQQRKQFALQRKAQLPTRGTSKDSSSSSSSDDDGPEHSTTGIGDMFRLNSSQH
jgi:hypothetical protein